MPKQHNSNPESPVLLVNRRVVGPKRALILFVQAGGRCEFDGCNKYVLKHPITQTVGIFGEMAHIVAFKERGPRGRKRARGTDPNALDNLMLLCSECHTLVDGNPLLYTVSTLKKYKQQHEANVYFATSIARSQKTAIVRLEAPIAGKPSNIPLELIHSAISPKHPFEKPRCLIDLNQHVNTSNSASFYSAAQEMIKQNVKEFLGSCLLGERVDHISVFALAPIPLLIVLGDQLSNTIPLDVYHHHHDRDDWTWKDDVNPVTFSHELLQEGTDPASVALLLSISGQVHAQILPKSIDKSFYIYQIRTSNCKPSTNALKTREGLENFRRTFEDWRRSVLGFHRQVASVHLFPAVPPPIAVLCGRELMPKVDPVLKVYDFNKQRNGFNLILEVNPNER